MKKIILAVTLLAVAGSQVQSAKANGWPIAAGVLGGLAVGTAVGAATAPRVVYAYPPQQVYYPSATAYTSYQPAPTYQYQSAPAPIANAPTVADAPAVTTYQPAPAPTVVYQSAPVVYTSPSYYYPPAPVIGIGFGYPYWGWGYRGWYGGYRGGYHGGGWHHR